MSEYNAVKSAFESGLEQEIDLNFRAFVSQYTGLLDEYGEGQFVLFRHQVVVRVFTTAGDAVRYGETVFSDRLFSVQEITTRPVDHGYFSHGGALKSI